MTNISSGFDNLILVYNYATGKLTGDTNIFVTIDPANDGERFLRADTTIPELWSSIVNPVGTDIEIEFTPNSVSFSLENGNYTGSLNVQYEQNTHEIPISLSVINKSSSGGGGGGGGETPIEPPGNPFNYNYGLKYWLEYQGVLGSSFRAEINEKDYTGESRQIFGTANLKYQDKKDHFEPIVSCSVAFNLEASTDLTLADLYSENEFTHLVKLYRNSVLIFVGFLKPDGIIQNWVSNRWVLGISAMDGLSVLKSLSFVTWNGLTMEGKKPILSLMKSCLDRTGLNLPINIDIRVEYNGFVGNCILESVIANTERYYQDEKKIMDCEAVFKSLLTIFNATAVQINGEWWIYRSIDIEPTMTFKKYVSGNYTQDVSVNTAVVIRSHYDDRYRSGIIHVGENQQMTIDPSIQAYRVNYKYGNALSIAKNSNIKMGTGLTSEGWTFYSLGNQLKRQSDGTGVFLQHNNDLNGDLLTMNQPINIKKDDSLRFDIGMHARFNGSMSNLRLSFYISTDNYYLIDNIGWVPRAGNSEQPSGVISIPKNEGELNWNTDTPRSPEDSAVKLRIHFRYDRFFNDTIYFELNSIEIKPSQSNIKGVYFNAQRNTRISSVTKTDLEVYNGDSLSDLFVGTLYKADGETPTSEWHRPNVVENRKLLEINAIDNLRISPRPMIVFDGDVMGYLSYLSLITIENVSGKFLPIQYVYNTLEETIQLSSKEFENAHLPNSELRDGKVEEETDYGNETKVTIVR